MRPGVRSTPAATFGRARASSFSTSRSPDARAEASVHRSRRLKRGRRVHTPHTMPPRGMLMLRLIRALPVVALLALASPALWAADIYDAAVAHPGRPESDLKRDAID